MPTTGSVDSSRRRESLAALVESQGSLSLADAASALGVSEMTIRRDFLELEADGLIRRVRGGAMMPLGPRRFEVRSNLHREAKQVIARKAITLVPTTGAVALDASTTVGALAALITDHGSLTAITNSWENFGALRRAGGARALVTGGEPESSTDSLVGPLACRSAGSMTYSHVFISASGADADLGSTDVSLSETQVKQEFARGSAKVVLLLDSTKLGERDVARSFSWDQIDTLVTELDPDDPRLRAFARHVSVL